MKGTANMNKKDFWYPIGALLTLLYLTGCPSPVTGPMWVHATCENGQQIVMHMEAYQASNCTILNRMPDMEPFRIRTAER
jgi:hypothetical protein